MLSTNNSVTRAIDVMIAVNVKAFRKRVKLVYLFFVQGEFV
jgi:chorismate mutase